MCNGRRVEFFLGGAVVSVYSLMGSGSGAGGSGSCFKLEDMAGAQFGCVLLAELRRRLFWLGFISASREGRIGDPLAFDFVSWTF